MENASKALLIAAEILIGLILITMIIYGYKQISSYYEAKEQATESVQLINFNEEYTPYNRKDVRGTDIISLVNKIIDFNKLKEEEEIQITIIIKNEDDAKLFYYNYETYYGSNKKLIKSGRNNSFTEDNIYNAGALMDEGSNLNSKYTQAIATKLVSKISTLMGENSRQTSEELLEELKINPAKYGGLAKMKEDILKYYQYIQFKRAHFDCEELTYTGKGRVKSFTFVFNGTIE